MASRLGTAGRDYVQRECDVSVYSRRVARLVADAVDRSQRGATWLRSWCNPESRSSCLATTWSATWRRQSTACSRSPSRSGKLVVVDDGSRDRSTEIAESYVSKDARIRVVRQANGGIASARNTGYRHSTSGSDYLIWLDADDLLEPVALEQLAGYLDEHPRVGLVFGDRVHFDDEGHVLREDWHLDRLAPGRLLPRHLPIQQADTPFASLFVQDAVTNPSSSVFRRSVYAKTPGYDESLGPFEDWDLVLRVALLSEVHFLPEKLHALPSPRRLGDLGCVGRAGGDEAAVRELVAVRGRARRSRSDRASRYHVSGAAGAAGAMDGMGQRRDSAPVIQERREMLRRCHQERGHIAGTVRP